MKARKTYIRIWFDTKEADKSARKREVKQLMVEITPHEYVNEDSARTHKLIGGDDVLLTPME